jgi:UDP-N-acetylmuramate dehydrogenase
MTPTDSTPTDPTPTDPKPADHRAAVDRAAAILASLGERVVSDGPIGPLTTYRVGGVAALRVTAGSEEDLELISRAVGESGLEVLVVGRGSNLLVADAGFPGLAVVLDPDAFGSIEVAGTTVTAGAAVALPTLARQTVEAGLTGLEWAVGVPGSVGGAVRMNAGGHGSDMAASLSGADVFDLRAGGATLWSLAGLDYRYRHSAVQAHHVVVAASFALSPGDAGEGRETIRQIVRWRREHQPGGQNAGSVFTNPVGDSAGRLIDASGLKGRRVRTAMVSPKHANFIQAEPGGSADDVYELLQVVRDEVRRQTGVELSHEVRLIGFGAGPSTRGSAFEGRERGGESA